MTKDWTQILGAWPDRDGPLYRRLSSAIRDAIANGFLAQGTRLPSERDLAQALGVSRNTVVGAYNALRDEQWLESRTGGGTWVSKDSFAVRDAQEGIRIERIAQSSLLGVMHREGDSAIDFASGTPYPLSGLPAEVLRLPRAEHERLLRTRLYYPFGYPPLREAIAKHLSKDGARLRTSPDDILVTAGAQQAIMLIAALLLERGDTALIEDPCYFGALDAFRAVGARIHTMPVGERGVDPQVFRRSVVASNPRVVYLTPTFQNPTGTVMPAPAREEILNVAAEHGVTIIDDRTLADIDLSSSGGAKPVPPLAALDKQNTVLTVGSLGKLMWAGLRIGWIRAARHTVERLVRIKMAHDLGTALHSQALAARMIAFHGEAKSLRCAELTKKRDLVASILRKRLPGWKFDLPSGGLFLWVTLPEGDARELAQVAMRHGLILLPGSHMSPEQRHAGVLRIPFLLDEAELREGMKRLVRSAEEYARVSRHHNVLQSLT